MNIKDHVHQLALKYPGGIAALATRMGIPYSTLKSKLNPNVDTHHLYIQDYELMLSIIDSDEGAKFMAAQRDGVFVKSHRLDHVSDKKLHKILLERQSKAGRFANNLNEYLDDDEISEKEYRVLMRDADDVIEIWQQIKLRIANIHERTLIKHGHPVTVKVVK